MDNEKKVDKIPKHFFREGQMRSTIGQAMNILAASDPAFVEMLSMSHQNKKYVETYNRNLKKIIRRANNLAKLQNSAYNILKKQSDADKLTYRME